ncbi:hypothetical protein H7U37_02585 [Pseudoflavonifractor phocaeensis]|uniref:prealbumin-like fold domain-containing protein n=1 Tax=Pseudoflavonifractor phocaeensis TaxID=1870988 RepID=UPI00195C2EFB|nr:prealbumin-like fold domain-containing protein [Pseudoflavonifractor phocaeensis]MBM6937416.1 hypothetical protein [Pseudoflavonifractor phocaeensis]
MANKKFRKGMALALTISMVTGMLSTTALAAGSHVHSDACGYAEAVEAQDCTHVHDETCGYVEGLDEIPCDMDCTDTDGDGVVDHSPDCAYAPAVEAQPCTHVHDETCSYAEAVTGQPCAVEEVEALIAALPAAPSEADRADVEAARAAYDALDASIQADVENLPVLTAAEEALANLEENQEEVPPAVELPQETCTVHYQTMSEGVTYDGYAKNKNDGYIFYYTIHENAPSDLVIDLAQGALDLWENDSQMPGDHYKFQILVKNESGNVYQYKNGSFVLAPEDTSQFGSLEEGSLLPVLTYDGQYMPIRFSGAMIPKYFYEDIFHVSKDSQVTFEMMCQIYDYLARAGYSGASAITDYLLDYFNAQRGTSYETLTGLFADHPDWLDGSQLASNGIYTMTEAQLMEYIQAYPWIDRFLYVQPSGSSLKVQIKWPEAELSAVSYNSFYMGLFSVVYGQENAGYLNPNPSGDLDFSRSHGVGDYLPGTALYDETNAYFAQLTQDGFQDGDTLEIWSGYGIDGPGMGNSYQNYSFTYYNVIELEQIDSDVTVNKVDQSGNALEGARFQLYKLDGETKLYYAVENGEVVWTADPSAAAVFEGGSFDVTLLFGTYYLTEIAAPDGYNRLTEDLAILVDENVETVDVTNTRQSSGGSSYTYYRVTIHYYDADGVELADAFTSSRIREGRGWDFSDEQPETITVDGVTYTFDHADGDPIEGSDIQRNQVVELYYAAEEEELTDEDTPLSPTPDEETPAPEEDLTDEAIPMDPAPETPEAEEAPAASEDQVELVDGETPLGDLPQTGFAAEPHASPAAYLVTLAGGLTGCGLYLTIRRKKED